MKQYEQMSRDDLLAALQARDEELAAVHSRDDWRYRSLFMSMREGFFLSEIVCDEAGAPCTYRVLDVNEAFERILGLPRNLILNKRMGDVVAKHTSVWVDVFKKVAATGVPCHCSYRSEPFGKYFELFAFKPAPNQYAVLITDVTEKRQAELALRESEARLRLFVEHAPASLAMFDRDMRYICATRRWLENCHAGDRDVTGMSHYELIPEVATKRREAYRRGLAGEVLSCDGDRFQRSDGSVHWCNWKVQPWHDEGGAIGGILIFSEDVTSLLTAREELKTSELRYRDIVENLPEFVSRYGHGGRITFVNDSLASFLGQVPDDLLGSSFYSFLHDEDRERVIVAIESLSAERPMVMIEHRVNLPGGLRWLQWKNCALVDADGNVVEYQATGRDVTERKQLQDILIHHQNELKLVNEMLEQRVKERTADLESAIRAQESFSYSVSHDLRAPLRHINSFSAMVVEDFGDLLPGEAHEYLARVRAASNRMGALIDHLLELSRVTRTEIDPAPVDLSALAVETLRMFRETEPGRRAELRVEPGITVLGDQALLRQLLENLLGNAWKYTSRVAEPCIEFGGTVVAGERSYFVRDNGAGFDMAYQPKLFKAFERLHGAEFEGVGIGLATAQRIVQRHGGSIWAEGAVGEGATFYFTLPAPP